MDSDGRSPHGERGLKYYGCFGRSALRDCRSPHGERGLKCHRQRKPLTASLVAPRTGSVG